MLRIQTGDDELVYHAQHDVGLAELDEQERAMLVYARKLNLEPATVTAEDIEQLRQTGFSEREILDIAMVVCMFNFMNRLADGLGVEIDPLMERKKERSDARVEEKISAQAVARP